MSGSKILLFILGLLTVIGGFYCAATPGLTFLSMIWVIGVVMLFNAVQEIVTWSARKKAGAADGWNLFGAIISCICGIAIIVSARIELLTGEILLYFLFIWLILTGLIEIFGAFGLRKFKHSEAEVMSGMAKNWGWLVLLGIIMVLTGCFGFAHPFIAALSIGFVVGIEIVVSGINMIARAFSA
ncbi:MAG: DUF308 domain-containing protein [Lachnospiraceae bacterium]|nr:DUF308 domain-containing protein [Lachnospiraceae bacterium]